ncbi:hypothetical protein QMT40_001801 [Parvibaculaceae bacterium PLY_AMNH_Bact1]|nr:hypothetical protein QMT40_001801 [Parvibaculaceae bacterium PLY_AMNH_Bact1]
MTDTPDPIGELIERLRSYHRGQVLSSVHIEAADTLSALQGQVRELKFHQRYSLEYRICNQRSTLRDQNELLARQREEIALLREALVERPSNKDATIATLRDALERLRTPIAFGVGGTADPEARARMFYAAGVLSPIEPETITSLRQLTDFDSQCIVKAFDEGAALAREPEPEKENG